MPVRERLRTPVRAPRRALLRPRWGSGVSSVQEISGRAACRDQAEQTTFTHCGVALPDARLPPLSIVPGTASIPGPSLRLAVLPFRELPAAWPLLSSTTAIPAPWFPLATLPTRRLPSEPNCPPERTSPSSPFARARFALIRLSWRSKNRKPVCVLRRGVADDAHAMGGAHHDAELRVAARAVRHDHDGVRRPVDLGAVVPVVVERVVRDPAACRAEQHQPVPVVPHETVAPHHGAGRVQDVDAVRLEGLHVVRHVVADHPAAGRAGDQRSPPTRARPRRPRPRSGAP